MQGREILMNCWISYAREGIIEVLL